jgi:preprotein translocase subunit SecE
MPDSTAPGETDELPRYLKVIIAVAILVILFVLVIDLLTFASAL